MLGLFLTIGLGVGLSSYSKSALEIKAATATDLFISEYIEGSSNNKAVEIYNGTGAAVDLSIYKIKLFANGAALTAPTTTYAFTGTLANNDVFVIVNASANTTFKALAEYSLSTNNVANFNGDDSLGLFKNDVLIDQFGEIGVDPGSSWIVGSGDTVDNTLVRNQYIYSPTTLAKQWTEWDVYGIDVTTYLGSHTITDAPTYDPVEHVTVSPTSFSLKQGMSGTATAEVLPITANPAVTWSSSNGAVATVSTTGKIIAVSVGSATITATTVGLNVDSLSETDSITVEVTAMSTIADLRDGSGNTLATYLGNTVTVKGQITRIDSVSSSTRSVIIQNGSAAVMAYFGYNAVVVPSGVGIGSYVSVTGVYTVYNGLLELTSPTILAATGSADAFTPLEITEVNWNTSGYLLGKDSRLVELDLTIPAATADLVTATARTLPLNLGATSVTVVITAQIATIICTDFNTLKAHIGDGGAITFRGILTNTSSGYRLLTFGMSDFVTADTDAIDTFISTYLYMDSTTPDQCLSYYSPAETAMLALTSDQKTLFQSLARYDSAQARYEAWAVATGDTAPYALGGLGAMSGTDLNQDGPVYDALIVVIIGFTLLGGYLVLTKRKHDLD